MSAALVKAIRARFAAAIVAGRKLDAREAFLFVAGGPQVWTDETRRAAVAAAFDELDARLDALADAAAEGVRRAAAVLVPDAGDRAEVLDDPRTADAADSGDARLSALLPASWPGDTAPDDVLDWIAARTGATEATKKLRGRGSGVLVIVRLRGVADLEDFRLSGAAVLYSVERSIREAPIKPRRADLVRHDVSTATTTTLQTLAGINVAEHGRAAIRDSLTVRAKAEAPELIIHWARKPRRGMRDAEETSLQLSLPGCAPTLAHIAAEAERRYGAGAVDLLVGVGGLMSLLNKRAGDALMLYPDELAEESGRKDGKDYRKRVSQMLDLLGQCRIVARYSEGVRVEGPLLATLERHRQGAGIRAYSVRLSPALYRGVREEDGSPGGASIAGPRVILRENEKVKLLPSVCGPSWLASREEEPVARFGSVELAERLGIRCRPDRALDSRQQAKLVAVLERGVAIGSLGSFVFEDEGRRVLLRPGPRTHGVLSGLEPFPRGNWIPETGADLADWLERVRKSRGLTAEEAASRLGVDRKTLWRATEKRGAAIPRPVREAFKRLLWAR